MKEYKVQAILIDNTGVNTVETVVNSFVTTDYENTLDFVMKKHKSSNKYLYIVLDIEKQNIVYKSKENKYFMWWVRGKILSGGYTIAKRWGKKTIQTSSGKVIEYE